MKKKIECPYCNAINDLWLEEQLEICSWYLTCWYCNKEITDKDFYDLDLLIKNGVTKLLL